jgi:hypothetical protein
MNRIRGGATALGVVLLLAAGAVQAQEITGGVVGRVTDRDTGMPLGGVTVIMQGPQGEDATLTDDKGSYTFTNLLPGTYVARFYAANAASQVEQSGVVVTADKQVRLNVKIVAVVQPIAQQTYVITGKPPSVDVGSARIGTEFRPDFFRNVPVGQNYGDVIERAPGTFFDPSGNVSIGGATGLENIYIVNGLNVTGIEYGNLENGFPSIGGGTNLPHEFMTQMDVNSGGYQAEYGGAMGGVINTVLKSGSNQIHATAWTYWSPYWLSATPNAITTTGRSMGYVRKPDYDTTIGVEAGGPLIKDKLFFWVGFQPRWNHTHVQQLISSYQDLNMNGVLDANEIGTATLLPNSSQLRPIQESRDTYAYAATLDFIPRPEHHLNLALSGTPNFNDQMRSFNGFEAISNPAWAEERLTKVNTDFIAHWTSKLYDHHWIIDAYAGLHNEYYNDRSPNDALNGLNQLEYWGANLGSLLGTPECQQPGTLCPVDNFHTGGFGLVKKYDANRWSWEVKGTNLFEGGGRHEVKYGWHGEYTTFDQDRYYSGPVGARGLVQLYPSQGGVGSWNFFSLPSTAYPSDFGAGPPAPHPLTDLLYPPYYDDAIHAYVKSLSNAFFLQDSYSPSVLRNLTVNAGLRLERQQMYDLNSIAFLDTNNLGPRLGAIYDPLGDGRSKISVNYGRYFEAIPMNIAARYFGGEGILTRSGLALADCANPDPYSWTGAGEWRKCASPGPGNFTNELGGDGLFNNGRNYPVQANLAGQFYNEVVATLEREVAEDTTVRVDYQHRWMGTVIEDGTADPSFTFVLANPGHVPQSALDEANTEVMNAQAMVNANPTSQQAASALAAAQAKQTTLQGLANAPAPERTYDAITLSANKKFSKNWFARAAYTYSRLVGNYEGLFQAEQFYFAPNGSNAYDTPDLNVNSRGYLPNDRPHNFKLDGFYSHPVGRGKITAGLSFSALSGMPRNYMGSLLPSPQEIVFLLPRGSAGRTPTVTQFDGHIAYGRPLAPNVNFEAFVDLFNLFDQQTSIIVDDNYTYDWIAPIENGTPSDLKFAKNAFGQPVNVNPNYGHTLQFQAPFHTRLGLRLMF